MASNICRFIDKNNNSNDIHIVNFVLETKQQTFDKLIGSSSYKMYYVINGTGFLHLQDRLLDLSANDVFFTMPGSPSAIESVNNFEYMYISFLGTRPIEIMDRLNINRMNCLFHNFKDELNLWQNFITSNPLITDIKAECVLLYTFSLLEEHLPVNNSNSKIPDTITKIKKYVDENIAEPNLSLDIISHQFSYNKKYISTLFKNKLNIGFSDYVNVVRIQKACALIEQGITSVQDLAYFTGYKDAMYFSRIFKRRMGVSPKQHMEIIK